MNGLRPAFMALDEQLHTDVMRFMAIIALCLVAIFALVRNTGPLDAPAVAEPASAAVVVASDAQPAAPPAATTLAPVPEAHHAARVDRSITPPPVAVAKPDQVEPAPPQAARPAPAATRQLAAMPAPQPAPVTAHEPPPVPALPAPAPAAPDAGLSLRFVDDPAFLRLLAAGRAELFAGEDDRWRRFGSDQAWRPAGAPPRFHELLLDTLPEVTLLGYPGNAANAQWGVVLPATTEREITRYLARVDRGTLLIDRHGNVRLTP